MRKQQKKSSGETNSKTKSFRDTTRMATTTENHIWSKHLNESSLRNDIDENWPIRSHFLVQGTIQCVSY